MTAPPRVSLPAPAAPGEEPELLAAVGERVYPGLVWMALHFAQAKVNWLTHDVVDSLVGTPEYKTSAVRVEPIGSALKPAAR